MADVHYFPRYTQRENFVTNNTLLLFQRLYDYNLRKFGKFLMELNENLESYSGRLGLHINQQIRTGNSVPDGFIVQHPLKIVITSFRDIIGAARRCLSEHDEDMNALVDDYEAFCSESDLLPRDDYTLFIPLVVNRMR